MRRINSIFTLSNFLFVDSSLEQHTPHRYEYHNWYVARAKGEPFLAQHGAAIAAGAPPLFGPMKEYGALNVALLKGAGRDGVYGSGSAGQPCFDKAEGGGGAAPLNKTIFASGYPVPVVDG